MARSRRVLGAIVVGLVGFAVLMVLQDVPNRHGIEGNLTDRSTRALDRAGLSTVEVSFTGRDGTVRVHSQAEADRALAVVRGLDGVRVVHAVIVSNPVRSPNPAPSPSPSPAPDNSATPAPTPSESDSAGVQTQLTDLPGSPSRPVAPP